MFALTLSRTSSRIQQNIQLVSVARTLQPEIRAQPSRVHCEAVMTREGADKNRRASVLVVWAECLHRKPATQCLWKQAIWEGHGRFSTKKLKNASASET